MKMSALSRYNIINKNHSFFKLSKKSEIYQYKRGAEEALRIFALSLKYFFLKKELIVL